MFRFFLPAILSCLLPATVFAQEKIPDYLNGGGFGFGATSNDEPGGITVTAKLVPVDDSTADVQVTVQLSANHYIYSTNPSFDAATKISITAPSGFEAVGPIRADREPRKVRDVDLGNLEKFFDSVTWTQRIKTSQGTLQPGMEITGELTGMYCSAGEGGTCIPIRPPETFAAALPSDFKPSGLPVVPVKATGTDSQTVSQLTIVPEMRLPPGQPTPIRFTVALAPANARPGDEVKLTITADIDRPWHTYSLTQTGLGGSPTELKLTKVVGLQEIGQTFKASVEPEIERPLDDIVLEVHYDSVTWSRDFVVEGDGATVQGAITFQICKNGTCQPPTTTAFAVAIGASGASDSVAAVASKPVPLTTDTDAAAPTSGSGTSMAFILSAISAGFLALLTPCVFPMIPITVSYFLKQGEERPGSTLKLAIIYCLGIVGAFTILGLLVAVIAGPAALQALANNPWLNLAFAGIFIVFALMLMGMFEVRMPSWLLTWTSRKQDSGGIIGVLFMAVTFTLVSFTCTFAFVGSLLALAADGTFLKPIIGMLAFSTAFASPFFVLAMFPSMLQRLPKSGGWMNSVKVTLGLLELVIVAKFLSVADVGFSPTGKPQFLDFSLVVGTWIAIATVTGAYLLGLFRLPHDHSDGTIGPVRCLASICCFGIAAYMSIGLIGSRTPNGVIWQQIAAFAPQRFDSPGAGSGAGHDGLDFSLDFDKAVVSASEANRPLFVDITGINCHNCRVMEQTVLSTKKIQSILKDLELVQVYTDSVPIDEGPAERQRLLKRNQDLQLQLVGHNGIPTYAVVTPDGKQILSIVDGVRSAEVFEKFLEAGLAKWKLENSAVGGSTAVGSSTAAVSTASFQTN